MFIFAIDMEINIIAAVGRDGAIGRRGDLIWRISDDLKRFKALTMGHPVIMGRKTWESLPKRPLPGRLNIVVSRAPDFEAPGAVTATSPAEALEAAGEDCFVMGGASIYAAFMPLATKFHLTAIEADCPDADVRLPWPLPGWHAEGEAETHRTPEGLEYKFVTLARD